MELDFSILQTIPPYKGDDKISLSCVDIDCELQAIQAELSQISIDVIPFDKTDALLVFGCALTEILLDFFLSDPANPDSLASKCNDKKSWIGKFGNKIHEHIKHDNNPLDFQGGFTADGEAIFNGQGIKRDISFGGGDHRNLSDGHDLLFFWKAIKEIHEGKFTDSSYIDGVRIFVETTKNANGNDFIKPSSWIGAIWEYVCHMFADFFSSKGLPIPGSSFLRHSSSREIRKFAEEIYKEGDNLRTEVLKVGSVLIPEFALRIFHRLRYKDSEWSKEAQDKKLHLLILMTHSLATAFNLGKVIITENPASLNLPMIVRTVTIAFKAIKDQIDFNARVNTKIILSEVCLHLEMQKTLIVFNEFLYYTSNYLELCQNVQNECVKLMMERFEINSRLSVLQTDDSLANVKKQNVMAQNNEFILSLVEKLPNVDTSCVSLAKLNDTIILPEDRVRLIKL